MIRAPELQRRLKIAPSKLAAWVKEGLPRHADPTDKRRRVFDEQEVADWLIEKGFADIDANEPVLGTRGECARLFGVKTRTVAEWLNDPTFPGRSGKPGRRDGFFPVHQIEAWRTAQQLRREGNESLDDETLMRARESRARRAIIEEELLAIRLAEKRKQVVDVEATRRLYVQTHAWAKQVMKQLWPKIQSVLPQLDRDKTTELEGEVKQVAKEIAETFRDGIRNLEQLIGEPAELDERDQPAGVAPAETEERAPSPKPKSKAAPKKNRK